jgi:hypothetical protein
VLLSLLLYIIRRALVALIGISARDDVVALQPAAEIDIGATL